MSNELSELQAVDFALGSFIASAFSNLNDQVGPKGYREFLSRPTNRRIFRHDADTPAAFMAAYRAAQAAEKTVGGAKINDIELPLVYYFRKPGLTNGVDKETTRRGRYSFSLDENGPKNAYDFMVLPLVLDYKLFFLSWDKPTLDKLQLAWYAYATRNETLTCRYSAGEDDVLEIPAHLVDHKSLLTTDESVPAGGDTSRVYAVSTGLQISTDVIFGCGVVIPEEAEVHGILHTFIGHEFVKGGGYA